MIKKWRNCVNMLINIYYHEKNYIINRLFRKIFINYSNLEKYYNEINLCETAMTSVYQFYIVFN